MRKFNAWANRLGVFFLLAIIFLIVDTAPESQALDIEDVRGNVVEYSKAENFYEIAILAAQNPSLAAEIAKTAVEANPDLAMVILDRIIEFVPHGYAAEIAASVAEAIPDKAAEIAGRVASIVPEAAAEIAARVAKAVPDKAVDIAGRVASVVPGAAAEIAARVASVVPGAAAEIADRLAAIAPEYEDSIRLSIADVIVPPAGEEKEIPLPPPPSPPPYGQ